MARNQVTQRQRSASDPLLLGDFDETSIRYLTGELGGKNKPITGGYGGGSLNHWFKIKLKTEKIPSEKGETPPELSEEASKGLVRARNSKGHYVSDDPSTPENEAWVNDTK